MLFYPSSDNGHSIHVILKNPAGETDHYTVAPKAFRMKSAEIVTVQGKVKETADIVNHKAVVEIPPYGFRILKLTLEK